MGATTEIAWCNSTFNPWWGCTRVDPACEHCYAETWARRTGHSVWGPTAPRRTFGAKHWAEPFTWDSRAKKDSVRRRVFCASMADIFDKDAPPGELDRLWLVIRMTPNLDWLLLTKRADRIRDSLPADWGSGYRNVWMGVTIGEPGGLWRLDELIKIPAVIRFVSVEPLLAPLLLTRYGPRSHVAVQILREGLDWVIVGGESGAGCRPMDLDWARTLRNEARVIGAAYFMKQIGGFPNKRDRLSDFPEDLRIREFPVPRRMA